MYAVNTLRRAAGDSKLPVRRVKSFVVADGAASGGTVASGILMAKKPELAVAGANPFCLGGEPAGGPRPEDKDFTGRDIFYDDDLKGWAVPFGMAALNTRVVRRSNALLGYGDNFNYREMSPAAERPAPPPPRPTKPSGPATANAKKTATSPAAAMEAMVAAGQLPKPGEGPSKEKRDASKFNLVVFAEAENGARAKVNVSGGDPGYTETAKMLSEAALCMALHKEMLPGTGGVLTPASALGTVLVSRLQQAGIRFWSDTPTSAAKL